MNGVLYAQGLGLGLAAAAPIGPVNVEIIRRGLTRGFAAALALGLGACSADMIYLSLVLGGTARLVQGPVIKTVMLAAGGGFLILLGVLALRDARRGARRALEGRSAAAEDPAGNPPTSAALVAPSPLRSYLTGLAMTLANPMTIAYWVSVSARLSGGSFAWGNYLLSLGGVATGTSGWVVFISLLSAGGRRWVRPGVLVAVNLLAGLLLAAFGLYFCLAAGGLE